jgi:uncharacterized membrane protein
VSHDHLAVALERNISALLEVQRQLQRRRSLQDRLADAITRFSGSMGFLYLHFVWFSAWIVVNVGWLEPWGLMPFDAFPFGLLTMVVSLEAIFLSTFVLISQQRLSAIQDDRADLDLQVNLFSEYEITRLLRLTEAIAQHLKLREGADPELSDLLVDLDPQQILREMEERKRREGI